MEGENIPEMARILGVADAYDAMTSNRSYRNALPQDVVRSEIEKGKGTQFDADIADIMLQMIDEDTNYDMKQMDNMDRNILVVDDEGTSQKSIESIMEEETIYEFTSAKDTQEALDLLKQQSFDLIMWDISIAEKDILETIRFYGKDTILATIDFAATSPFAENIKQNLKTYLDYEA